MSTANVKYKISQDFKYEGEGWWKWIKGEKNELDQTDHVIYTLHSTFNNPVRKVIGKQNLS